MHDNAVLVEERLNREVAERVLPLVHPQRRSLTISAGSDPTTLTPFSAGEAWGPPWTTTWFRLTGDVPAEWAGERVEALIDLGFDSGTPGFQCEGLIRDADGQPVQGIHPRRTAVAVETGTATVDLLVEAASNPTLEQFRPSPLGDPETAGDVPLYRFGRAELVVVDPVAEALLHDFDVLVGHLHQLEPGGRRRQRLLATLERALEVTESGGAGAGRAALAAEFEQPKHARAHQVVATGHAHIDTAWLWPLRETVRKCVRTFASAVQLMDADPEYVFSCSQAQQYDWIRQREPELFERIRKHVAGGQFVPIGGMWVESDMNMPAGESIVRQIVHGQRFFEAQFGVRCTEMWIPDVFGYPAGLPQVFAAGGMKRFVTQKLSWNRTNRFPHSTFWWEGLDGTRVLTHFPPVDTYNAEMTAEETGRSMRRFADHGWSNWSLVPYGYGDGGGGPTREMLERTRRLAALEDTPQIRFGRASELFDAVEAEASAGAAVPVWSGELYFETHRGTLTSQLGTKDGNRRAERLLRQTELLLTAAHVGAVGGVDTDPHQLDELWQTVLTQQFHDIIPGSSIAWVHDDAERLLGEVATELGERIDVLAGAVVGGPAVVDASTTGRHAVALVDATVMPGGADGAGDSIVHQHLGDGTVAVPVRTAGLSVGPLGDALAAVPARPDGQPDAVVVTDRSMSNGYLAVSWALDGRLTSVIDVVRGRELLRPGRFGAQLQLAADHPVQYDAWDLESWTVEAGVDLEPAERVTVDAGGPLFGAVGVHHRFGESTATLRYVLRAGSPRLDIEVDLDWHEREQLLSIVFPLDVRTATASCGVQFGKVDRPTHRSTSWDAAKFEVCAHRYVDLSEPSFGVAVLDDGRYGHGLFDDAVRVSLARGARYPDPDADIGRHRVTLAVLPHGPGLAEVVAEAERLEYPLVVAGASIGSPVDAETAGAAGVADAPAGVAPVAISASGVEVDALKPADDGTAAIVVRFHEAVGDRAPVTIRALRPIVDAVRCNLLEEPEHDGELDVSDGIVALTLRPFELVTLRLDLAPPA